MNGGDYLKRGVSQYDAEQATDTEREACRRVCLAMGWDPDAGSHLPNWTQYLIFVRAARAAT